MRATEDVVFYVFVSKGADLYCVVLVRGRLERWGRVESEDIRAPPVHRVSKVYLELLEKREER